MSTRTALEVAQTRLEELGEHETLGRVKAEMGESDPTLSELRAELQAILAGGGDYRCPLCGDFSRLYKRPLASTAARLLLKMHHLSTPGEFVHVPTLMHKHLADVAHQGGYATLAHHWGLLEEAADKTRPDGGRAGWWKLTAKGRAFVEREIQVQQYAHIFKETLIKHSGPMVSVRECLGVHFNYDALMAGTVREGLPLF